MNKTEIYYYKLDKDTGKVNKIVLNARKTYHNYPHNKAKYRFQHPCGNTADIPIEDFDKVSSAGIWLVSFKDDTKAATSLFKAWWKDKLSEADKRLEDATIWQSKIRILYDSIAK